MVGKRADSAMMDETTKGLIYEGASISQLGQLFGLHNRTVSSKLVCGCSHVASAMGIRFTRYETQPLSSLSKIWTQTTWKGLWPTFNSSTRRDSAPGCSLAAPVAWASACSSACSSRHPLCSVSGRVSLTAEGEAFLPFA